MKNEQIIAEHLQVFTGYATVQNLNCEQIFEEKNNKDCPLTIIFTILDTR